MSNFTRWRGRFWALVYWQAKTTYGLWRHPYQTLAALMTRRAAQLNIFAPGLIFALLLLLWRLWGKILVSRFLSASCTLMFIKTSVVFCALFWQISLLYLWLKFKFFHKERLYES